MGRRLRLGSVVWLGMILAGACLGAFVVATWPEPTIRLMRLPYGESMPKTPSSAAERQAPPTRVVASARVVSAPQAQPVVEETEERTLAGPPPVASELERDGYPPETPEELGAKPLPGMDPGAPKPAPATEAPNEEEVAATPVAVSVEPAPVLDASPTP